MKLNNLLRKLFKLLRKITPKQDKLEHFYWGTWFCLIGYLIGHNIGYYKLMFIVPMVCGLIKEISDYKDYKVFDMLDVWYTLKPSLLIYLTFKLCQ